MIIRRMVRAGGVMRRQWMDTQKLWKAAAEELKGPRRRKAQAQNPEFPL